MMVKDEKKNKVRREILYIPELKTFDIKLFKFFSKWVMFCHTKL